MTHCSYKHLPIIVYLIRFSPVNPHTCFPFVCFNLHISWAIFELWPCCFQMNLYFNDTLNCALIWLEKKPHLYINSSTQIRNYVYSPYAVHQTRQIQDKYGYAYASNIERLDYSM